MQKSNQVVELFSHCLAKASIFIKILDVRAFLKRIEMLWNGSINKLLTLWYLHEPVIRPRKFRIPIKSSLSIISFAALEKLCHEIHSTLTAHNPNDEKISSLMRMHQREQKKITFFILIISFTFFLHFIDLKKDFSINWIWFLWFYLAIKWIRWSFSICAFFQFFQIFLRKWEVEQLVNHVVLLCEIVTSVVDCQLILKLS